MSVRHVSVHASLGVTHMSAMLVPISDVSPPLYDYISACIRLYQCICQYICASIDASMFLICRFSFLLRRTFCEHMSKSCHYSMINMSVHMSVRLTYVTVSKSFSERDPSSGVWSAIWVLEQSSNNGAQRCALEWFSKAWFAHNFEEHWLAMHDFSMVRCCQQTMGTMGILFGYVWVDCLHG